MYHFFNSVFIRFTGMYQAKIKRKENEKKKMKRNVIIGKKNNQNLIHVILCLKFLTQVHNNNKNDTIIIKATFHIV